MTDDLRERVARAIDATIRIDNGFNIENLPEVADAALAEMGEPAPVSVREAALASLVTDWAAEPTAENARAMIIAAREIDALRAIAEGKK